MSERNQATINIGLLAQNVHGQFEGTETLSIEEMTALTDKIRAERHTDPPFDDVTEELGMLLGLLMDAENNKHRVSFFTVLTSHLDKLVRDLTELNETEAAEIEDFTCRAGVLKRKWQTRFGESYFAIDEIRLRALSKEGALCRVALSSLEKRKSHEWVVSHPRPGSDKPGALHFKPGRWWIALPCAYRDGIVGTSSPTVTRGLYGVTAFPLVQGEEIDGDKPGEVVFMCQGALQDIGAPLLTEIGRSIRILRGHELHSKYAPAAGIRYDGLYTLRSWGHKLDLATNIYHSRMVFGRNEGQRALEEILPIPMPSQLDDWALFQRIRDTKTRNRYGNEAYFKQKHQDEQIRTRRNNWIQRNVFEEEWSKEMKGRMAQGEIRRKL